MMTYRQLLSSIREAEERESELENARAATYFTKRQRNDPSTMPDRETAEGRFEVALQAFDETIPEW